MGPSIYSWLGMAKKQERSQTSIFDQRECTVCMHFFGVDAFVECTVLLHRTDVPRGCQN